MPQVSKPPLKTTQQTDALLRANRAHDLTSSESLIRYNHSTMCLPVKETWCKATNSGNYSTWPWLTVDLARRHFPDVEETVKLTTSQKIKNIRSTKTENNDKTKLTINATKRLIKSKEEHDFLRYSSKMCSDQTGKFPYVSRNGNQCLMIVIVIDANVVLAAPFKNKTKQNKN